MWCDQKSIQQEAFDSARVAKHDARVTGMWHWAARDSRNFVRDTIDGYRVNVYWAVGGYWLIQAGRIERGEFEFYVGRRGKRAPCGSPGTWWMTLRAAKRNADFFGYSHGGWVGDPV